MAYTTPRTWVTGEVVDAALLNTYLRDNDLWVLSDSPAVRAYRSTNQILATSVQAAVLLDQERFDNANVHSTVTNTNRFTVPAGAGGKWIMGVGFEYNNSSVVGDRISSIILNGVTATPLAQDSRAAASTTTRVTLATSWGLSAADYFDAQAFQSSGGNLNLLTNSNYSPELWAYWLRT